MANIDVSKITLPNNNNTYIIKDNSQSKSNHRHYEEDIVPILHKTYESTSYYATAANQAQSTWYFMSIKPDSWYKPWRVKFKIHSFCPNYSSYESITQAHLTGRSDSFAYANWNERQDTAHYYTSGFTLKKAGFDAGYGHAVGISILYGGGYTNSAYYRTFELDYYECENCTVTILDTPVKQESWIGYNSTNYNGVTNMNAVDRGLQETGDANSSAYVERPYYTNITAGGNGIKLYSLFARLPDGTYSSFTTDSGTGTKTFDTTTVFDFSEIYYANRSSNLASGSKCGNDQFWVSKQLANMQYTCNGVTSTASTSSLTAQKYLYLIISHDQKLVSPYYTQTPTASTTVYYVLLGFMYDCYRLDLWEDNPIYEYDGTSFKLITIADAQTVNGHTVAADVPSTAEFTDTTYTGTGLISINSTTHVISTTAEVNQNAFSNVKVGTTTIAADTKTDTLELAAGNGIILTPDATNDKVTINSNIYYGTCTTAASTAAKVATLVNSTGFTLTTGVTVKIKFSNYNSVANPTLNVSSTGAIPIMRYGATAVTTSVQGSWADGAIITLTYDGTNWVLNDKNETYVGTSRYAHAEGSNTIASANNSHAEGSGTTASGYASHAEGGYTIASGNYSHAEGGYTPLGGGSVIYTIASGDSSHAEGFGTIANHKSQHVFGEFNIEDASTADAIDTGTYVEIVGNGIAEDARSNARTLDWGGNEVLAGSIGISNGACKLQYNSTTASCDFIFS